MDRARYPDRMSKPHAEGVDEQRRATLRANLIKSGMEPHDADRWIEAWVADAALHHFEPSGKEYWQAAGRWIGKKRPRPPERERRTE